MGEFQLKPENPKTRKLYPPNTQVGNKKNYFCKPRQTHHEQNTSTKFRDSRAEMVRH
jgi:hypothetical protein